MYPTANKTSHSNDPETTKDNVYAQSITEPEPEPIPGDEMFAESPVELDPRAEARLRLKIDLMILPTVSLLYLLCSVDRANIGNARIAGLEEDLRLKGYDFNIILSIFSISYILFELPSNILCKKLGPGWFIPASALLFGVVSIATAFVQSMAQAAGVRFALGTFEAGMLPGVAYYLSRWYRRSELAFRISIYTAMTPFSGAFGGLLASGILGLYQFGSLHRWRMIFVVEGIITCGLAVISFVTLTDRPETARWLNNKEKDLAVVRVKSERVGQTQVLEQLNRTKVLRGIFNPVTLTVGVIFLLHLVTVNGLVSFLPTIIQTIYPNKTVVEQQLQTVPPYIVGALSTLLIPFFGSWLDRRLHLIIMCSPLIVIGYIMFLASESPHVRYGATFLVASGAFPLGPLCTAAVSANVVSDTARTSALATQVMIGSLGSIIGTWSFLPFDAPNYHIGNGLNLAASSMILIVSVLLMLWMTSDNKKRQKRNAREELQGLNEKEIEDLDWKHPEFRWHP
ncbi:hypothetical protein V5O48_015095 [Marasmius crinis-equi]|uniref:Major facilitator superfamily (MFS) profile domain-containing protein n=1 Tax=Marasmius crinis-equi TaxID=585013 RepID=A0ABR3EVG1_9AGAR